jgi:hypothetical protein
VYRYTWRGKLATASDRILTHEYTAVICMDDLSLTLFPELLLPMKKLYTLPAVLF